MTLTGAKKSRRKAKLNTSQTVSLQIDARRWVQAYERLSCHVFLLQFAKARPFQLRPIDCSDSPESTPFTSRGRFAQPACLNQDRATVSATLRRRRVRPALGFPVHRTGLALWVFDPHPSHQHLSGIISAPCFSSSALWLCTSCQAAKLTAWKRCVQDARKRL